MTTLTRLTCLRCGYAWWPRRTSRPVLCASRKCRSPYWDRPREKKGDA